MDVEKLMKALENEDNSKFINLTTYKLTHIKLDILKELHISKETIRDFMQKLKVYSYCDEMNDLRIGSYIKWIPISNPNNIYLTKGAIFCEIKTTDSGISLVCKNYMNKFFTINMDTNLIFQKLTDQEQILLSALDHLAK